MSSSDFYDMSSSDFYDTPHTTDADDDGDELDFADQSEKGSRPASTSHTPRSHSRRTSLYTTRRAANETDEDEDDAPPPHPGFATQTAFDSYFLHASRPARTSAHVFSHLVAPLTPDEFSAALARAAARRAPAAHPSSSPSPPSSSSSNHSTQPTHPTHPTHPTQPTHSTRATYPPQPGPLWEDEPLRSAFFFGQWATELAEGFNLLFYGYGSKRRVLNAFARELARGRSWRGTPPPPPPPPSLRAHVVVVNGFQPGFALKDLLGAVGQVPALRDVAGAGGTSVEAQTQRIYEFFSSAGGGAGSDADSDSGSVEGEGAGGGEHRLFLVIHNIDGPALRSAKAKACLALLALAPRIHLVASIDHIAAPTQWTLAEIFAHKNLPPAPSSLPLGTSGSKGKGKGKQPARSASASTDAPSVCPPPARVLPRRGFAWLWHDLTTLAPYDFELASADPSSLSGASARRAHPASSSVAATTTTTTANAPLVTETAARHVLASVTQKARRLFVLLGGKQLELMGDGAGEGAGASVNSAEAAYDYERLFGAARDEFVATSDTALRALLGEFRDHGVVVSVTGGGRGGGGGGEALWIPMRRDALGKLVAELKAEGA